MQIKQISVNTNLQNTAKNSIHKKQNNTNKFMSQPSFSRAYLGALQEEDIRRLFFDAQGLLKLTKKVMPVLENKFNSFFDATLNIFPDVRRTINIKVSKNIGKTEELKKYIVDNNHKFHFPQQMIEDFKLGKNSRFDSWLDESCYVPIGMSYDKLGEYEATKRILDFANDINNDKIISDIYKMRNHDYTVNKKVIPTYYWEFPGG